MTTESLIPTNTTSGLQAEPGEYRIHSQTEVLALLRQLLDERTRIVLSTPGGAAVSVRLDRIDAERGVLGLDVLPHDPQLQLVLGADEVTANAFLDQIRVAFEVEGLVMVGGTVLRASLPALVLRFQRRQSFRVKPSTRTPQVKLRLGGEKASEHRLRIIDISVGGLALVLPAPAEVPEAGTEYDTLVELDRENVFRARLRLQHACPMPVEETPAGVKPDLKLGFAWADLGPAAQRAVQVFIDQTQRMNRLLRKG
ncbi:flagellar brake protein [Pelomonas sp. KK5]|uniref:flagellar brake protein n=1 Tax=Pelomonas sp. KK5 TaxID=1855730 RepID=UPI00097C18B8|nr:flagellar brake protein [Pelomonas sp. KK5]